MLHTVTLKVLMQYHMVYNHQVVYNHKIWTVFIALLQLVVLMKTDIIHLDKVVT